MEAWSETSTCTTSLRAPWISTGRPRRFAVALRETDRLIGGVGLDGSTGDGCEEPSLGYWLGQPYWRNGYGREAVAAVISHGFRTLGLETIRAYTMLREGAVRPSSAELILFCRDRIGYKAPEEIIFLDEMPLNPTGKIDRVGLKKMAEDHLHPHGLPPKP